MEHWGLHKAISSKAGRWAKPRGAARELCRYAVAVGAVGLAAALRWGLDSLLGKGLPFITFFPAVAVVGMVAGGRAGLVATALAAGAASGWFLEPRDGLAAQSLADLVALGLFVTAGVAMSITAEMLGRARQRAWQAVERERAAEQVQKLNRTLKARSQSNAAMVRAASEPELLQAVCKIVVEDCAHAMVCVGFAEADPAKSIRLVAHAGFEAGYLETVRASWADTARGRGPGGTAIRTGKPSQCQDIRTDPSFAPWREEALRRGYLSVLTLPLLAEGRAFGLMAIYSRQPAAFSGEEVRLLTELADDLAYGISTLRLRAARAQAEAALRQSEERLRRMENNLPDSALYRFTYEPDGTPRFLYISAGVEALNGVTVEEALRDAGTLLRQIPPDYRERLVQAEQRSAGDLSDFNMELPMRRPDGQERWMRVHSRPHRRADGRIVWDGIEMDITERKRAEAALRESEGRFRAAFEQGAIPMVVTAPKEASILKANPAFCQMLGYTEAELQHRTFYDITHPEDLAANRVGIQRMICGEQSTFRMEKRYLCKDGRTIWVDMSAAVVRDAQGQPRYLVTHVLDITERKAAEEAVRRAEAGLTQAVRVAGLGTFEHDHRSNVVEYSPVMRELMSFGPEEPVTLEAILHKVPPGDREALAAAIGRAHDPAGDGSFALDHRVLQGEGGVRWVSKQAQTFFEGEGRQRRPVRTIGAALDITARKQAQAELERLVDERTAKLQELVGELEHFSYTITHDMRAPLRAMQGFAEMMTVACGKCQEREPKVFLQRIGISAERMDALITDALNYSRTVRQELPLVPVDVGRLLRGMVDTYPELQPTKAQFEIDSRIPLVLANEAGLTQCFSNLLGNAVKFGKPGHRPHVRVWAELIQSPEPGTAAHGAAQPRYGSAPTTAPGAHLSAPYVRIWVEDDGIGIPEPMLPRVFDMFARGHQGYEGTGIGLALVRKVAHRMGGQVGVQSEEGQGSRFWLDLQPGARRSGR